MRVHRALEKGLRQKRKGIDEAVNHLTGKAEHLHYDTALERG